MLAKAQPHPPVAVEPLDGLSEPARRAAVERVLADPHIAKRLLTDRGPAVYVQHPSVRYLAAMVGDRMRGFFALVRRTGDTVDIHAALQREALPHCRALGRLAISSAFADSQVQRVVALVMQGLESARNYALRCGMALQWLEPCRTSKDGIPIGAYVLCITRNQWGAA